MIKNFKIHNIPNIIGIKKSMEPKFIHLKIYMKKFI
jgi:hypothetical protein